MVLGHHMAMQVAVGLVSLVSHLVGSIFIKRPSFCTVSGRKHGNALKVVRQVFLKGEGRVTSLIYSCINASFSPPPLPFFWCLFIN